MNMILKARKYGMTPMVSPMSLLTGAQESDSQSDHLVVARVLAIEL